MMEMSLFFFIALTIIMSLLFGYMKIGFMQFSVLRWFVLFCQKLLLFFKKNVMPCVNVFFLRNFIMEVLLNEV